MSSYLSAPRGVLPVALEQMHIEGAAVAASPDRWTPS
jgi:hypothetical protein